MSYIHTTKKFCFQTLVIIVILYLILVCLHSSGSLDSHTTLSGKDDLELEVFVYTLSYCWGDIMILNLVIHIFLYLC